MSSKQKTLPSLFFQFCFVFWGELICLSCFVFALVFFKGVLCQWLEIIAFEIGNVR